MTRYCPKCKSEISPLDLVCPHCGAKLEWKDPVANQSQPITPQKNVGETSGATNSQPSSQEHSAPQQDASLKNIDNNERIDTPAPKKGSKKWLKVFLILAIISGLYNAFRDDTPQQNPKATSSASQVAQSAQHTESEKTPSPTPKNKNQEKLDKTYDVISSMGVTGNVTASSYENSDKGFMAIVDRKAMIFDTKNNQYAIVDNINCIQDFANQVSHKDRGPIIVRLAIPNATHDQDEKAGFWEGNTHHIPFYIVWTYENNQPVDDGIFTGAGQNIYRYETPLYESKNVTLAHIFLSDAIPLLKDDKKQVN